MITGNSLSHTALPPLALIAGPTASGKSETAVQLAEALRARGHEAVVINADSAQVYADLAVLSARPTEVDMRNIPHRLYGTWDGARPCSAADWATAARAEIAMAHAHGAVPIVVGGTGLYIRTLLDGIAPVPPIDPAIRAAVRAMPVAEAHAALTREDPDRAARLAPTDTTRVARALEVVRATGHPLAHWQTRREGGIAGAVRLASVVILPPREVLHARCDARFAAMLAGGAIDEVQRLLARNLPPDLPVMRAIGVAEIAALLRGDSDAATACHHGQLATRQYVKRQSTWLRNQLDPAWPRVASGSEALAPLIERIFQD